MTSKTRLKAAQNAFESACGGAVTFITASISDVGAEFTFMIPSRRSKHTIATSPMGDSIKALEDAAIQAGRWAKHMSERVAA